MNYTITVTLTTHAQTDDHLRDEQGIRDEVQSWFEGLGATVRAVTVDKLEGNEAPTRQGLRKGAHR